MDESRSAITEAVDASATLGTDPLLYSKRAIDWFSILITPLFGCVMLAMNVKTLNRIKGIIPVLSFGLAFSLFIYLAVDLSPIIPVFVWNGIGTVYIHHRLWNRYLGRLQKYESRSIWKPLVLALSICGVILLLWLYSDNR